LHFEIGNKSDASFYAGILIAAFALAEACSSVFWGALSDRLGRKPVVLIGCLGTIVSLLSVGFSTNFWMALVGRALGGALNGNMGVIQTMVGEMITNPKHERKYNKAN
jgi:MFS family permease